MKMKRPQDDVKLTNGSGYMVEQEQYREHLTNATEIKQVIPVCLGLFVLYCFLQKTTCRNYRAMAAGKCTHKNLDETGLGACACARHGCFVPHCVVGFQKGERYEIIHSLFCLGQIIFDITSGR
jgi:hypothetical protein